MVEGIFDVATHFGGRLPELLAGSSCNDLSVPAIYPSSCIPQAWASAAPLLMVRSLLRLDPWLSHDELWLAPALPESFGEFSLHNVRVGDDRVTINGDGSVQGLSAAVTVHNYARYPTAELR